MDRECGAERADGFGVLRRLLLDLQQLGGLDEGLQGGGRAALLQVPAPQPLLHLTDVVPDSDTRGHTGLASTRASKPTLGQMELA